MTSLTYGMTGPAPEGTVNMGEVFNLDVFSFILIVSTAIFATRRARMTCNDHRHEAGGV